MTSGRFLAAALAVTVVGALASPSLAGDASGAVVDWEVAGRVSVSGSLRFPDDLETYRMHVPAGGRISIEVKGSRRGPAMGARLFDEADTELAADQFESVSRGQRLAPFEVLSSGLYRIDVFGDGERTGKYRLRVHWETDRAVPVSGAPSGGTLDVPFLAEARSKAKVRMPRGADAPRLLRVSGPDGFLKDYADRKPPKRLVLGAAGDYVATFGTADDAAVDAGSIKLSPRTRPRRVNTKKTGPSVPDGRVTSRRLGPEGGCVVVPLLGRDQVVGTDISGAAVVVPQGALSAPTTVFVRTGKDFDDPDDALSSAGIPVQVDSEDPEFDVNATVVVPFDIGAFPLGFETIRVFRRDSKGNVSEVPPPFDIDSVAGTISFPRSRFSSFNAFRPGLELALVRRVDVPIDIKVGPDGTVYVAVPRGIWRFTPPDGEFEPFAGGGFTLADGSHRLDYFFTQIEKIEVTADGGLLVAETIFDDPVDTGRITRITPEGLVFLAVGEGRTEVADGVAALDVRLPELRGVAADDDGNIYILDARPDFFDGDDFDAPKVFVSRRVLKVDAQTGLITILAGDTQYRPIDGDPPLLESTRPRDAFLLIPGSLLVDSAGRILVGDSGVVVRFDVDQDETEIVAGVDLSDPRARRKAQREVAGVGAPLRNVLFGRVQGLAFDPSGEEFLYVADDFASLIWRLDLVRGRAYIVAGDRRRAIGRIKVGDTPRKPFTILGSPGAVALQGTNLFIAETLADIVRVVRPR